MFFYQLRQEKVHVCRLLTCTRLSTPVGIRSHSEGRLQVPHTRRRTSAAMADCLPSIRDSMFVGGDRVVFKCESGNLSLHTPRRHGSTRPFVGTEYISLTQPDMDYLVRVIPILQQHLHDYIIAMPDMLSYVTSSHRQHMLNLRLMQALSLITTVCTRNL